MECGERTSCVDQVNRDGHKGFVGAPMRRIYLHTRSANVRMPLEKSAYVRADEPKGCLEGFRRRSLWPSYALSSKIAW
jgi:hypothetical protein